MVKIKRVRTADCVVAAFRMGKESGTVGSLILGMYDEDGQLRVVGHTSGFSAKQKRELLDFLEPYRTHEQGSGEPSRWKSDEELVWEGLRPELVCEIAFDHITGQPHPPRREAAALARGQAAGRVPDRAAEGLGVELEVLQADVTKLDVDAIANAANTRLLHGGGVAGAIMRAGGPTVQQESNERAPIDLGSRRWRRPPATCPRAG